MGLDDQNVLCEAGDSGQRFNGIIAMVKDAQIENDIEFTNGLHRKVRYIDLARFYNGSKCGARNVKCLAAANLRMRPTVGIGCEHAPRAATFRFEAEKSIPSTDIEHGASAQVDAIEN